jgi:hypothetical protein
LAALFSFCATTGAAFKHEGTPRMETYRTPAVAAPRQPATFLRVRDVAKMLGCSAPSVWRWSRLGLMPKYRIPDDWIDNKRYPLFMAREVMRALIEQLEP